MGQSHSALRSKLNCGELFIRTCMWVASIRPGYCWLNYLWNKTRRVYVDLTGRVVRPPTLSNLAREPVVKRVTESQSAIEARIQQPQFSPGLNMPSATYVPMLSQQPGFLQPSVGIGMPVATFPPRFSLSPPAFSTGDGLQHLAMLGGQGNLSPTYDHIIPVSCLYIFERVGELLSL